MLIFFIHSRYYILLYSAVTFPLPILCITVCYGSITYNVTKHFQRRNRFSKALGNIRNQGEGNMEPQLSEKKSNSAACNAQKKGDQLGRIVY